MDHYYKWMTQTDSDIEKKGPNILLINKRLVVYWRQNNELIEISELNGK